MGWFRLGGRNARLRVRYYIQHTDGTRPHPNVHSKSLGSHEPLEGRTYLDWPNPSRIPCRPNGERAVAGGWGPSVTLEKGEEGDGTSMGLDWPPTAVPSARGMASQVGVGWAVVVASGSRPSLLGRGMEWRRPPLEAAVAPASGQWLEMGWRWAPSGERWALEASDPGGRRCPCRRRTASPRRSGFGGLWHRGRQCWIAWRWMGTVGLLSLEPPPSPPQGGTR